MTLNQNPQRVIITGGSGGLGKATALAFASAGLDVALVGRSREELAKVAQTVRDMGVVAKSYQVDLANVETVKGEMEAIAADFAPIDILINNAGMGYTGLLRETPLTDWQRVLDLNLTGVFACILGVLPLMRDRGRGTIVNVASIAAQTPFPGWGVYSVSKAGVVALSKALGAEERGNGIRVITVLPGAIDTPLWDTETVQADFPRSAMLRPEVVAQSIVHAALLPQEAVIEEITLVPSAGVL